MDIRDHAEDLAKQSAGNHRKFEAFAWRERPQDDENWAIFYTSSRDSGLMAESNESVINKALDQFTDGEEPDVVFERHNHWAVGYVDGFAIRVYKDGQVTPAFLAYTKLYLAKQDYPLLDESDYSDREFQAALEAIEREAPDMLREPEGWAGEVFGWLCDNEQDELENIDDQGAMPSSEAICRALQALKIGYHCPSCDAVVQAGVRVKKGCDQCS